MKKTLKWAIKANCSNGIISKFEGLHFKSCYVTFPITLCEHASWWGYAIHRSYFPTISNGSRFQLWRYQVWSTRNTKHCGGDSCAKQRCGFDTYAPNWKLKSTKATTWSTYYLNYNRGNKHQKLDQGIENIQWAWNWYKKILHSSHDNIFLIA
jgi:hypothetical protein